MLVSTLIYLLPAAVSALAAAPSGEKPLNTSAGLIFIQGAQLQTSQYADLLATIQKRYPGQLFTVAPSFLFDVALGPDVPFVGGKDVIDKAFDQLTTAGLPKNAPVFLCGHSLGGVAAQQYAYSYPSKVKGLILTGSTLLRKVNENYTLPTLMLNGEADGQFKPMRAAESFFKWVLHAPEPEPEIHTPVVMIPKLTHMGFASYDNVPALVRKFDLKPILPLNEAHERISAVVSDFLTVHTADKYSDSNIYIKAVNSLRNKVKDTLEFFKPMLRAMELEGSYRLMEPCNSDTPSPHCPAYPQYPPQKNPKSPSNNTKCMCGSPFVGIAQKLMFGLNNKTASPFQIEVTDARHPVSEIRPVHLPHIWNNCTESGGRPCVLNVTTVSENSYEFIDDVVDPGLPYVSAHEMRMKLKSRQSFIEATIDTEARKIPLEQIDPNTLCRDINQHSYELGLSLVPKDVLARYERFGTKMVFGKDYIPPIPAGPFWINSKLGFKEKDLNGTKVVEVVSTGFKTAVDTPFSAFSPYIKGFHYCKVLSPARVVEWVYTDGLRNQLGY